MLTALATLVVACDGGGGAFTPPIDHGEVPDEPEAPALVDEPTRSEAVLEFERGLTVEVEPLDGGEVRVEVPVEVSPLRVFVTPLRRYKITPTHAEGCAPFVVRARGGSETLELDGACFTGAELGRASEQVRAAGHPLGSYDAIARPPSLVFDDGESVTLWVERDGELERTLIGESGGGTPRLSPDGAYVFWGDGYAYEVATGARSHTPGVLVGEEARFALDGRVGWVWRDGAVEVFGWGEGGLRPLFSAPVLRSSVVLSSTGSHVAYKALNGYQYVVDLRGEEPSSALYGSWESVGWPFVSRAGEHPFYLDAASQGALHWRGDQIRLGVRWVATGRETDAVMLVDGEGVWSWAPPAEGAGGVGEFTALEIGGEARRATSFPGALVVYTREEVVVVDVDAGEVAQRLEGTQWRPFQLGSGRLMFVGPWDLPTPDGGGLTEYPICRNDPSRCEVVVTGESLSEVALRAPAGRGVPFGEGFTRVFVAGEDAPPGDECVSSAPAIERASGEQILVRGLDWCHVQRRPELHIGAPCVPYVYRFGGYEEVRCAR
jgi:hypothetical protein